MEIIKYHNDINKIKTGSFTEKEIDIFFSILFKMKDQQTKEIVLEFSELKGLIETTQNNTRLINQVKSMNKKIINLNQEIELPNGDIMIFNLFEKMVFSPSKRTLTAKVTETFSYMINDLLEQFTTFDLKELVALKSAYSKHLFKFLRQYQRDEKFLTPWYLVDLETFKELIGVPKDYATRSLNQRVLNPIEKELSPIFKGFKIEKLTKEGKPVGKGKKTHSLKFTWSKEPIKPKQIKQKEVKEVIKYKHEQEPVREAQELSEVEKLKASVMMLGIPMQEKFKLSNEIAKLENLEKITEIIGKYI